MSNIHTHRVLKVCKTGDFYRKRIMPYLRLKGNWLAALGIAPESHVLITSPRPGTLLIQALDPDLYQLYLDLNKFHAFDERKE